MEFEGLASAVVRVSVPILLVVIGEIVAERAGVLNIGLEGMVLVGAFGGFAGTLWAGAPVGIFVGVLAAVVLAGMFAGLVLRAALDPIVTGVAVNVLALGITGVLFRVVAAEGGSVIVAPLGALPLPGLAQIPGIGPALFSQNALGYLAFASVPAVAWFLARTSPGLIVRAAGENPEALETAGIDPRRVRLAAVLFCGAMAGAGGAYLSVGYSNTFVENMSAGRGFVALAIVVFARWNPWGGAAGALLFGLAMSLQVRWQGSGFGGVEIPYQFFQMLPYVLTLVVLATTGRRRGRAPAALAQPDRRIRA